MRLRRIATAVALTAVLAGGLPTVAESSATPVRAASAAVPGYGPKTVVMTTCVLPASTLDWWVPDSVLTASGPANGVYGFASCRTKVPGAIYFFLSRAGRSMHQLTPYRGTLEAMASDGTGAVYLCYSVPTAAGASLYIARRSAQGRYSPSALLTRTLAPREPSSVTLAAANGKWWAVWPEVTRVDPVDQSRTEVLYEQRTLLGVRPRHQITFPGQFISDVWPALGVTGSQAWLVWVRIGHIAGVRMIARARPDGTWGLSYVLDATIWAPLHPSRIAISDGRTYIVYPPFAYLDNGTGHFISQDLYLMYKAYLAASDSVATIAQLAMGKGVTTRALAIDELRGDTWSHASWPTVDSFDGVVSYAGRATFVLHKQNVPMLYLITET